MPSREARSATTPGWGIMAMSGASAAPSFVMMSWLMFSTFSHSIVIPLSAASSAVAASRPCITGASTLVQMETVVSPSPPLSPPSPLSPPQAPSARDVAARVATTPIILGIRMTAPLLPWLWGWS